MRLLHRLLHSFAARSDATYADVRWRESVVGRAPYHNTDDGFPHGFEVQAIGPSSARQVLLFMCIVSTAPGRLALHRTQIVTDARDL